MCTQIYKRRQVKKNHIDSQENGNSKKLYNQGPKDLHENKGPSLMA